MKELLNKALNTRDYDEQMKLVENRTMRVRKALSMNKNIHRDVVNLLAYDPTLNVSYMATKNSNCSVKREFNLKDLEYYSPCIKCDSLDIQDCFNCNKNKE